MQAIPWSAGLAQNVSTMTSPRLFVTRFTTMDEPFVQSGVTGGTSATGPPDTIF